MTLYKKIISATLAVVFLVATGIFLYTNIASAATANFIFPVIGTSSYSNDYYAPRSNGIHEATDIIAPKHAKIVSVVDGRIVRVEYPQPSWGYSITIESDSGYRYRYIHMNNDTPGTDNGQGGPLNAYAVGMKQGDRVNKGQLIGWVGDSGNAEGTVPHVHFEKFKPDGTVVNPYYALNDALRISTPRTAPRQPDEILPNGQAKNGVNVDTGNFAGDSTEETVTGLHAGTTPSVAVYNRLNTRMYVFNAYAEGFEGGVDVAAGDVDGDGIDEIITGPGKGGAPLVKVFEADGTFIDDIFAYPGDFRGGVRVSAGDVDGDGTDEIITGAGPGYTPRIRAFKLDGTVVSDFLVGSPAQQDFSGGVDVTAGDVRGDGKDEIISSYAAGGGPYIRIHDMAGANLHTIVAYATSNFSGVRVSAGNIDGFGKDEIATVLMTRNVPLVKVFDGTRDNNEQLASDYFWEEWWRGYYDVGAGENSLKGATGVNRRSSVRDVEFYD